MVRNTDGETVRRSQPNRLLASYKWVEAAVAILFSNKFHDVHLHMKPITQYAHTQHTETHTFSTPKHTKYHHKFRSEPIFKAQRADRGNFFIALVGH